MSCIQVYDIEDDVEMYIMKKNKKAKTNAYISLL